MMKSIVSLAVLAMLATPAMAQQAVRVTVENLQLGDGFFLTPIFAAVHDGNYDVFNPGEAATPGLQLLAEDGVLSDPTRTDIFDEFSTFTANGGNGQAQPIFGPEGFGGAPVIDPGESSSAIFNLAAGQSFFNFGTMVIPSNDSFLGNGAAINLFDAGGNFVGYDQTFTFDNIWDAGTEVNNTEGAAFSAAGGTRTDQGGVVELLQTSAESDLSNFNGLETAAGTTINTASAFAAPGNILRVTVTAVPEPSTAGIIAFGCAIIAGRRRRKA